MTENVYQGKLIKKLESLFPGCVVLKNDSGYQQGMLDLTVLYQDMWATLEVKASHDAAFQPNQAWWLDKLNNMSFAAIIHPQNEEEVLNALQQAFESPGRSCVPQS